MVNQMVLSEDIEWIGYDRKKKILQVEFIEGDIYQFSNVSEYVYQEFLTASSHMDFFESEIKDKYPGRKTR